MILQRSESVKNIEKGMKLTQKTLVYLRNSKKIAFLLAVQKPILSAELFKITSQKMKIPTQRIILIHNGKLINFSQDKISFSFTQKAIIHVLDNANINKPEISVSIKFLGQDSPSIRFSVQTQEKIGQFMAREIKPNFGVSSAQTFLVYVGKPLYNSKKFKEQLIQDGAEIMLVKFRQEIPVAKQFVEYNTSFDRVSSVQSSVKYGMPVSFSITGEKIKKLIDSSSSVAEAPAYDESQAIFTAPQEPLHESVQPYQFQNTFAGNHQEVSIPFLPTDNDKASIKIKQLPSKTFKKKESQKLSFSQSEPIEEVAPKQIKSAHIGQLQCKLQQSHVFDPHLKTNKKVQLTKPEMMQKFEEIRQDDSKISFLSDLPSFKTGDFMYCGFRYLSQSQNLLQDILNDYGHLFKEK